MQTDHRFVCTRFSQTNLKTQCQTNGNADCDGHVDPSEFTTIAKFGPGAHNRNVLSETHVLLTKRLAQYVLKRVANNLSNFRVCVRLVLEIRVIWFKWLARLFLVLFKFEQLK